MIKLGETQNLYINRQTEHGVYLCSEYNPDKRVKRTSSFNSAEKRTESKEDVLLPKNEVESDFELGESVEVFVYRDSNDRLIATRKSPLIKLHEVKLLKVASVAKIGAFVEWGLPKDLLLPFKEQTRKVSEGEEVLVALYIDKSDRLCLTMNVYDYLKTDSPYKAEDRVKGRVYQISQRFGAFVAVDDIYSGLIPAKEVMPEIKIGRIYDTRVTNVREDGKLTLSYREKAYIQMDADAKRVMEVIESFDGVLPFSDSASAEVIKREVGISKNAFKRAVGRLYKERKVEIKEHSIVKVGR